MFIEWNDTYNINVAEVDQQHQRLFDLINELHEAMTESRVQPEATTTVHELTTMTDVLEELMDYTSYHFSTEEGHMTTRAYPEYGVHKSAHGQFIERVQALQRDFDSGRALHSMEIAEFIRDWWQRHILVVDKKLGVFLNEKGLT
ncbi:MAG: hemerythrin family protein [Phycisphaerae bacterium]|nr:hemerythrin family protein [Phycisphaerae bacterium]